MELIGKLNKLNGVFKEIYSDEKDEEIYDKNGNILGDNFLNILPSRKG